MKENIERIFKEQLDHYELPYNPGAWETFSKRLDGTPSTPFYRKWWFAASAGTILVGSATFFTLSSKEVQPETLVPSKTIAASPSKSSYSVTASHNETAAIPSPTGDKGNTVFIAPQVFEKQEVERHVSSDILTENVPYTPLSWPNNGAIPSGTQSVTPETKLIPISVPSTVCLNEAFTIENPNSIDLHVKLPGGAEHVIPGKKSLSLTPTESGIISLKSGKLNETVTVNTATSRLFINDDASVLFENGIPTVKFEVTGAENEVSWQSNIASRTTDKNKMIVHPFREKQVEVTASSTDHNGCVVTEKKTIRMEGNYNLIAMEAFRPLGEIEQNKLFMPFALTLRDTPFELTILDPKNGTPVYITNDPLRGWDGMDQRKGEMVPMNSVWSWKVIMKNPLPGEPAVYSGTVTRL